MRFRDDDLERRYQGWRNEALRRHDQRLLKYAVVLNAAFNLIAVLALQTGVAAGVLYCATLLVHAAALTFLKPATYIAYRNVLACSCRLSWHLASIMGIKVWSGPNSDSPLCFVKILTYVSGIVALNWLHVFTVVSPTGLNLGTQAVAVAGYIVLHTPQHVCPLIMEQASHAAYMQRLWKVLESCSYCLAQVLLLPIGLPGAGRSANTSGNSSSGTAPASRAAYSNATAPPLSAPLSAAGAAAAGDEFTALRTCVQSTMFLQVMLGLVLPCLVACWTDFGARQQFLVRCWQRQEHLQQQQELEQHQQQHQQIASCSKGSRGAGGSASALQAASAIDCSSSSSKQLRRATDPAAAAAAAMAAPTATVPPAVSAAGVQEIVAPALQPALTGMMCHADATAASPAAAVEGWQAQQLLLDHPLEWVFHYRCLAVYLMMLFVGLWLLMQEMSVVLLEGLRFGVYVRV